MPKNITGFTLVELAIVLFIMGLLLAGLLSPLATSLESEQRSNLEEQLSDVEDALYGFIIANGRFPCPDCPDAVTGTCVAANVDDGVEDTAGAGCMTGAANQVEGNLPWVTLGVTGVDPWGRLLNYQVQLNHADTTDGTAVGTCNIRTGVSFQLCSTAGITIQDLGGTCVGVPANVATNVPAVVYSQGKELATSCNELENTDLDNTFVAIDYNLSVATYYDDMIIWLSPNVLISKMVKAEILP